MCRVSRYLKCVRTCQGQELALATSPPTTLSSTASSSRYLGSGWSSASTESTHTQSISVKHRVRSHTVCWCACLCVCMCVWKETRVRQLLPRAAREVNKRNLSMSANSWDVPRRLLPATLIYPQGSHCCVCVWECMCVSTCVRLTISIYQWWPWGHS